MQTMATNTDTTRKFITLQLCASSVVRKQQKPDGVNFRRATDFILAW